MTSMNIQDMFGLWWDVPWVRYLVLLLLPIGVIDAYYTHLLLATYGPEYEYNPFVRLAFIHNLGIVWGIVNIVSFALFTMLIGSYYLYTRGNISGNKTPYLSLLLCMRIGIAIYNVFVFYWVYEAPFFAAIGGALSYVVISGLMSRDNDVSIKGFKRYFRAKYDRFHDKILTLGLEDTAAKDLKPLKSHEEPKSSRSLTRRIAYILIAIGLFVSFPFVLTCIAEFTGAAAWTEMYGDLFYWNYLSAPTFMMGFVLVIVVVGVVLYLLLRAFDTTEGAW